MGDLRTLQPRGWRPIIPRGGGTDDVSRCATTELEFEWLGVRGGLAEGETFPSEDEMCADLRRWGAPGYGSD